MFNSLVLSGLWASFAAEVIKAYTVAGLTGDSLSIYGEGLVMPLSWRIATFYAFAILVSASIYSLVTAPNIPRKIVVAIFAIFASTLFIYLPEYWRGFSPYELVYFKGPATWLSVAVVAIPFQRLDFKRVSQNLEMMLWLAVLLFLSLAMGRYGETRVEILRQIGIPLFLLQFLSLWQCARDGEVSSIRRYLPLLILFAGGYLSATRSIMISAVLYFILSQYVQSRGRAGNLIVAVSLLGLLAAFTVDLILNSNDLLQERVSEDTRSEQYLEFFSQVSIWTLLAGAGPRSTWIWQGANYGSIDGSLILIAYIGGIFLLIPYLICLLAGVSLRSGFRWNIEHNLVPLAWLMAMLGLGIYVVPEAKLFHYFIFILAGRACVESIHGERNSNG